MLLLEPQETAYDWHFQIAGIPVRVHPGFWLLALMLFARAGMSELLVGTLAVLVSLLVHELGHALTMQYFGERARVVLYMMGGLAIPESSVWNLGNQRGKRGAWAQVLISAAGPGAGFLLAGAVLVLVLVGGGRVEISLLRNVIPVADVDLPGHSTRARTPACLSTICCGSRFSGAASISCRCSRWTAGRSLGSCWSARTRGTGRSAHCGCPWSPVW